MSVRKCSTIIIWTIFLIGAFGRTKLTPPTSEGFYISKDKVEFPLCHLQIWALSSTNLQKVLFRCVAFQPHFMPPSQKPTLRIHICHPYQNYEKDIKISEGGLSVPHSQVMKPLSFSLGSKTEDLKVCCSDGLKRHERVVPVHHLLTGEGSTLIFELQFSQEDRGKKKLQISLQQGTSTLAEQELTTAIEEEPDYTLSHMDRQGRFQVASDKLIETMVNVIQALKDVRALGYKLGFSYSAVEKYLKREDASFDSVSRLGFSEMLRDWRRQVQPREQVDELHVALQNAGLGHTAEVTLHALSSSSKRKFTQSKEVFESKK